MTLYLTHRGKYRVRTINAVEYICLWDDDAREFVLFRSCTGRRVIPIDDIAAVASCAEPQRHALRWAPIDDCYRDAHQRTGSRNKWVHPYARRAA